MIFGSKAHEEVTHPAEMIETSEPRQDDRDFRQLQRQAGSDFNCTFFLTCIFTSKG